MKRIYAAAGAVVIFVCLLAGWWFSATGIHPRQRQQRRRSMPMQTWNTSS